MNSDELTGLSLSAASAMLHDREISPVEYLSACLARIDSHEPDLHAFIKIDREGALDSARKAEMEIIAGNWRGPLHGIPVALKDIFDVKGQPTTNHSRISIDAVATHDSFVVARLRAAGAILIGKTAMHEFATGGPSFDLPWAPARNPWNPEYHPGGSSSGSGVAVAAGYVPVAIGTDTGGSVRHPATACGIVGMKPTYGSIGRTGVFPLSRSLDHVGVLARSSNDNAIVLEQLLGPDIGDPDSVAHPSIQMRSDIEKGVQGLRVAVLEEFGSTAHPEIRAAFEDSLRQFASLGASLSVVKLSPLKTYAGIGRQILQAEAYALHEEWIRTRSDDYGRRTLSRILPGREISAADYIRAQDKRAELAREFYEAITPFDAALCISSLEPPCAIDDDDMIDRTYDRHARAPFNLVGAPAISIPIGFSDSGLPIGLQIVGRRFSERTLYRIAQAYEGATDWYRRRPHLTATPTLRKS